MSATYEFGAESDRDDVDLCSCEEDVEFSRARPPVEVVELVALDSVRRVCWFICA